MSFFANPDTTTYPWPQSGSLGDTLYNTNYDTAFQRLMEQYGLAWGNNPAAQFVRGLSTRSQQGYEALVPQKGLGYKYTDYLMNEFPKVFQSVYNEQTPQQQGLNSSTPGIGRTRYIGWPTG